MTTLLELMNSPLQSITKQKRLSYRPNIREVRKLYKIINAELFGNQLPPAKIELRSNCRGYWGYCYGDPLNPYAEKSYCTIILSDKWYSKQWLISILAHEMIHQYQWDIYGKYRMLCDKQPAMGHGPSFYEFTELFNSYGIPLTKAYETHNWFKYQKMTK